MQIPTLKFGRSYEVRTLSPEYNRVISSVLSNEMNRLRSQGFVPPNTFVLDDYGGGHILADSDALIVRAINQAFPKLLQRAIPSQVMVPALNSIVSGIVGKPVQLIH